MMPLRCNDQSFRWIDITYYQRQEHFAGAVTSLLLRLTAYCSSTKACYHLSERLRKLLMRQVTAFQEDYQPRSGNLVVETLAISQGNLPIVFTPEQERGLRD